MCLLKTYVDFLLKFFFRLRGTRLGDSKDSVREKAEDFILKLMEWSIQPQILWERLLSAFVHRNNKVREEIHKILIVTLNS